MGPTGITSALTFSSGIRGQTGTGSLTLHNHDFARVPIRGNTQQPQSPLFDQHVPNTPIPPLTTIQTVSESQSSRFAIIEETDGGFIINPTSSRRTEVRSTSQETVITLSTTREASAPAADYESVTAEQWQRNYGCKLTKANVFRLYITNRLLPGDRNYIARVIGGAIVQSVTEGEDATFGRVRRTKDAIVGYFQRGLDVYEREAARLGIKPNITHQTYAAPGLASAALVLVPENSDQVITEIAVMLGLHVVGVGVARSTTWMYNRARSSAVVVHGVPRVSSGNLTKQQVVHYLENVDKIPMEQLTMDLQRVGFELVHAIPEQKIYKFSHVRNELRGTGKAKANLGSSKIMVEIHCDSKSGPHMHITDFNGNVYDKHLNNLTAKVRSNNPYWHSRKLKREVESLPEAHIKIKEFVELNTRLIHG